MVSEVQQERLRRLKEKHADGLLLWKLKNGFELSPRESELVLEAARGILFERRTIERGKHLVVGVALGETAGKTYADIEIRMRHTMQAIKPYVETFGRVVYALCWKKLRSNERSYVLGISEALLREYEKLYYQAKKRYPERLKEIVERHGGGAKCLEYKELDRRKEGFPRCIVGREEKKRRVANGSA
jgi:hypothetical protein